MEGTRTQQGQRLVWYAIGLIAGSECLGAPSLHRAGDHDRGGIEVGVASMIAELTNG